MSNETAIPIGEFRPRCPHCGADLLIEHDGVKPKPDDRVFCAEHGTIGTRETIATEVLEQNRDRINKAAADHAKNALRDALKGAGFKIE